MLKGTQIAIYISFITRAKSKYLLTKHSICIYILKKIVLILYIMLKNEIHKLILINLDLKFNFHGNIFLIVIDFSSSFIEILSFS